MTTRTSLLALGLVALAAYFAGGASARRSAALAAAQARVDTVERIVARTDTVYRAQVRTLTRELVRYDSARVTDTLVVTRHDTAVVYVERAAADNAVRECRALILTCSARVAAGDTLANALRGEIKALNAERPGWLETWGYRALSGWIGYELGKRAR